jgi:hypothetical protein
MPGYRNYSGAFWKNWGATLIAKRPEITLQTTDQFVTRMFETDPDFVFTVSRDFVRSCQNPVLILPDEVPAHPYAVAMECAMLAPKAEVSIGLTAPSQVTDTSDSVQQGTTDPRQGNNPT